MAPELPQLQLHSLSQSSPFAVQACKELLHVHKLSRDGWVQSTKGPAGTGTSSQAAHWKPES